MFPRGAILNQPRRQPPFHAWRARGGAVVIIEQVEWGVRVRVGFDIPQIGG